MTISLKRQIDAISCLQDEGDKDAVAAAVKTLRLFHRFEDEIRATFKTLLERERGLLRHSERARSEVDRQRDVSKCCGWAHPKISQEFRTKAPYLARA